MVALIENGIDTDASNRLAEALRHVGVHVVTCTFIENLTRIPQPSGLFHGTIDSAYKMRDIGFRVFGLHDGYSCRNYMPALRVNLLNQDAVFLPYGLLSSSREMVRSLFGDQVFIRPDSNAKLFTGQVVSTDPNQWDINISRNMNGYDPIPSHEMVVISSIKQITEEYRSIVLQGRVVSTARAGENSHLPHMNTQVQELITGCTYNPDPIWILDTAVSDGRLKILEVGGFSTSSLYGNIFGSEVLECLK